jgi:hypothetical protein
MSLSPKKHHLNADIAARALQMAEDEQISAGGGHLVETNQMGMLAAQIAEGAHIDDPALESLSEEQRKRLDQMGAMMMGKKGGEMRRRLGRHRWGRAFQG